MKNPDTITVIAILLVLPWLARVLASAKAILGSTHGWPKNEMKKKRGALADS